MSAVNEELAIERIIDAPRAAVWRAMTDHIIEWWCPRPWSTRIVALDWRSGGRFSLAMHGPDGEVHGGDGMLLEVVPGERIVFTNALGEGWVPQAAQPVAIVGMFTLADAPDGRTAYRASARHWSAADMNAHDAMGFAAGWGVCAEQLGEVARRVAETADA
ncbi:SRPBCC domain-containing protein [uncultured Sphingomonas sp.]|mgnify:CR=1 FL=1|uniref:SRPBCC domain-containing protein n=1 Tax=uncultured Sphingomonas sp. TaxID=158754 RepID=UPI0026031970|nr:SRPBCC domain-containing protein [uncultured Sphingomonas sp.]